MIQAEQKQEDAPRFAVHYFDNLSSAPFDAAAYSRMKFGSDVVAKRFGYEMADAFFADPAMREILREPCVALSAPATTVPIASTMLLGHFLNRLNRHLDHAGMNPVEWSHVHRNFAFNDNYASAPFHERMAALSNDDLFINRRYVEGKTMIWLDDVVITGAHEQRMENFVRAEGLDNPLVFISYARYSGDDPTTEAKLNHFSVKTPRDIIPMVYQPGFRVTTRSIRLILKLPANEFDEFILSVPRTYLEDLYNCAVVKRYSVHEDYLRNFSVLREKIKETT